MKKKVTTWNRDKKASFVSKKYIQRAKDLMRKLKSPNYPNKVQLREEAIKLLIEIENKIDNKRVFFANLKEQKIYFLFKLLTDKRIN